jgi:hypothetical protein
MVTEAGGDIIGISTGGRLSYHLPFPEDRDDAVNLPVYPEPEIPLPEAMPLPVEPMMEMDMGMPDFLD